MTNKSKKEPELKTLEHEAIAAKRTATKPSPIMMYVIMALLVISWGLLVMIGNYSYNMNIVLNEKVSKLSTTASSDTIPPISYAVELESLTQRMDFLEDQLDLFSAPLMDALSEPQKEQPTEETSTAASPIETSKNITGSASNEKLPLTNNKMLALEKQLHRSNKALARTVQKNTLSMLLVATINLRETASEGIPFTKELAAVQALGKGNPTVQNALPLLQSMAEQGIPTMATLQQDFDTLITPILKSAQHTDESSTITRWLRDMFSDAIRIRRVGNDIDGETAEAIIARAESFLQQGDLRKATVELEKMESESRDILRPWLRKAKKRLAAVNALDGLYKHVVTLAYTQ